MLYSWYFHPFSRQQHIFMMLGIWVLVSFECRLCLHKTDSIAMIFMRVINAAWMTSNGIKWFKNDK